MEKRVNINLFTNGYSVATGGSCLDLPIAILTGNFDSNNYTQFLSYKVVKKNWGTNEDDFLLENTKYCNKLGLDFNHYHFNDLNDLFSFIVKSIDIGVPILMPVTYNALFYYLEFNGEVPHMLLITGYDIERSLILITDCNMVRHELPLLVKDYTLYELAITKDIFNTIWKESEKVFSNKYCGLKNNFYTITKKDNNLYICNKYDFIKETVANYNFKTNNCTLKLNTLEEIKDIYLSDFFRDVRRDYWAQFTVLFNFLSDYDKNRSNDIHSFKENFLKQRNILLTKLQTKFSNKSIDRFDYLKESCMKIIHQDEQIFNLLNNLLINKNI